MRIRVRWWIVAACVAAGLAAGLVVWRTALAPSRVRIAVEDRLRAVFDHPVRVRAAWIDLAGDLHARGVALAGWRAGPLQVIELETDLVAEAGLGDWLLGDPEPRRVRLMRPRIRLRVDPASLDRSSLPPGSPSVPAIRVAGASVELEIPVDGTLRRVQLDRVDLDLRAGRLRGGGTAPPVERFWVEGSFGAAWKVAIRADDVPIERLLDHPLVPARAAELRSLQPRGAASLRARLRADPSGSPVVEGEIALSGVALRHAETGVRVREVRGKAGFDAGGIALDLAGTREADGAALALRGRLDPRGATGRLSIEADALRWDEDLAPWIGRRLPPAVPLPVRGTVRDLLAELRRDRPDAPWDARLAADLEGFEVEPRAPGGETPPDHASLPFPVRDLRGSVRPSDGGHRATLTARTGPLANGADNLLLEVRQSGPLHEARLEVEALATDLPVVRALRDALPPHAREIHDRFRPGGRVDLHARVSHQVGSERPPRVDLDAHFHGASMVYEGFPLPIEGIRGDLRVRGTIVVLPGFEGRRAGATFHVRGEVTGPAGSGSRHVMVRARGVPIDPALRLALAATPYSLEAVWDDVRPGGVVDVDFEERVVGGHEPKDRGTLRFRDATAAVTGTPYPLEAVNGVVRFEGPRLRFEDLRARTSGTGIPIEIRGDAQLAEPGRGSFDLSVTSDRLPLEAPILARLAASPALARTARALDVSGEASLAIRFRRDAGRNESPSLRIEPRGGSVRPPYLASGVTDLAGWIEAEGSRVRGALEGRLDDATVRLDELRFDPDAAWPTEMTLSADDLAVGPGLLRLPNDASGLEASGRVDVLGVRLRARPEERGPWIEGSAELDLRGVRLGEAIEDLRGRLSVRHASFRGSELALEGTLSGDRLAVAGNRVDELVCDVTADTREVRLDRIAARFYRGKIRPDGSSVSCRFGPEFSCRGELDFDDVRLRDLGAARFPQVGALRGRIRGHARFEKLGDDLLELDARGSIEVRDARLFEVPILNALVRILPLRRPPVFTRAGTDFRVRGGTVRLRDLFFYSTPLRLNGEGDLDLDGTTDILLHPEFAPDAPSIFLVSDLWNAIQNRLIAFRVEGPIEEPLARVENVITGIWQGDRRLLRPLYPPFPDPPPRGLTLPRDAGTGSGAPPTGRGR